MTVTLDTGLFGPYGGRYVPEALIAALAKSKISLASNSQSVFVKLGK